MSERTQEMYVRAVRQLAQHYHKSPDLITEEELRQYFLFIKNVKHYSRSASTIAMCGIKFFFEQTLHREWPTLSFVRAAPEKKLPVILSPDEVRRILGAIRLLRYRVCLSTIYSCGLRLQEGTHLQVPDIDSARLVIHLRHRKGNKDRYLPLPQPTLTATGVLIFPSEGRRHRDLSQATEPLHKSSVQDAFRAARTQSGIHPPSFGPHAAPFLGDPSAGGGSQPATDSRGSGT
jgi:site-specific recombinase XerD